MLRHRAEHLRIGGNAADEAEQLGLKQRHQEREEQPHADQKDDGEQRRRQGTGKTAPLQPVRHRVEEIGNGDAENEGEQNAAQQIDREQEDRECQQPVKVLPLPRHHRASAPAIWRAQTTRYQVPEPTVVATTA